jgi:hypothetical protein
VAEVRYIFGDVLTGQIIQEIDCQSVSINAALSGGDWRGTLHLDQTGKVNDDLISATIPGKCYVVTERDGIVVDDHILWTRTYQSQAKSMQLYAKSWKLYPYFRHITEDLSFNSSDQITVFRSLYDLMQSYAGSISVTVPVFSSSGIERSIEVAASELKTYGQVIDSFADTDDGFDWVVDTSRQGGSYERTLRVGYPRIGAVVANTVFEYQSPTVDLPDGGGNVINYWENESMGSTGTHLFAVGGGEGDVMPIAEAEHSDLLTAGFPRYDVTTSHKDITDAAILAGIARAEAVIYRPMVPTLTLEVKADVEPVFGGYALGDLTKVEITDAKHPQGFTKETRILGWEYYPPGGDNIEYARLVTEGQESA